MQSSKLALTLLFTLGLALTNCQKAESCPPFYGEYFDINGISYMVHYYQRTESAISAIPNFSEQDFDSYRGVRLKFSVDFLSQSLTKPEAMNGFGNLYALSCISNGEFGAKSEAFSNITILTVNDFKEGYLAGDTLNDLLLLNGLEAEAFIEQSDSTLTESSSLWIRPEEKPTLNSRFQVKAIIQLNNGEVYVQESTVVELI